MYILSMNTENNTSKTTRTEKTQKNIQKRHINNTNNKRRNNNQRRSGGSSFKRRPNPSKNGFKRSSHKEHVKAVIPELAPGDVRVIPIGGVEQVGQNMNIIETKDDIFVVDIGIQFSNESETPGVDYIIPNIKYLVERKDKIRAVFVTHGHLDHIGAFPYIIDQLGYPKVYCGLLTKWMIDKRNSEFPHLEKLEYHIIEPGNRVTVGNNMKVQVFAVTHSIPDALGFSF